MNPIRVPKFCLAMSLFIGLGFISICRVEGQSVVTYPTVETPIAGTERIISETIVSGPTVGGPVVAGETLVGRSVNGDTVSGQVVVVNSGSDAAQRVRTELSQLHSWLGSDQNSTDWKTYLHSADLERELDSAEPNIEQIAKVYAIYAKLPTQLRLDRIRAVENAIGDWLKSLSRGTPHQLPNLAKIAKVHFVPLSDQDVEMAKKDLANAVRDLDQFLMLGSADNRDAWQKYLQWKEINEQLEKPTPEVEELSHLYHNFTQNNHGLELEKFRRVREAIDKYRQISAVAGVKPEQYTEQLDKLIGHLEAFAKSPTANDAAMIGHSIGWLDATKQAPQLVSAVRDHFWRPNLYATVSSGFVAAGVDDTVTETRTVQDSFMGTDIFGTVTMNARVGAALIPDMNRARIELRLSGIANSQNTGQHKKITICSSGTTSICGWKSLSIDEFGVTAQPATAQCETNSQIDGIGAKLNIVRKIANKKANESKGMAEEWASGKAERQIAEQMDSQAVEMLAKANDSFSDKFRNPLHRLGIYPRVLRFNTTSDQIHVTGMHVMSNQLSAPTPPPSLSSSHDMTLRLHESLIGNVSETVIGGETITDVKMEKLVYDMTGEVPEELKVTDDKDAWSITFANDRPIGAEFKQDGIVVTLRGRRFTRNDQVLKNAVDISATYKVSGSGATLKLVRQGDVDVAFVGREKLGVSQVAFKTFLRKKFDAMFKSEIEPKGVQMKGRFERMGKIYPTLAQSKDGWLSVGWDRSQVGTPTVLSSMSIDAPMLTIVETSGR